MGMSGDMREAILSQYHETFGSSLFGSRSV